MMRREAAGWLARLQSGRDPQIERKFRRWHDSDPGHAAAFERVRRAYEQAGLLRHSPMSGRDAPRAAVAKPGWSVRPALAAAAAILVLVPAGAILVRSGSLSFAGGGTLMLMTGVGEIRQVELADGSKVTLDTSTKLDVRVGGSRRTAHLRYGRARFQIASGAAPFVIEAAGATVDSSGGVVDVEQSGQRSRVQVLAGAATVLGSDEGRRSRVPLGPGESATVTAAGVGQKAFSAPASDWTRGMLQFDATPLADAVELANRYSKRHIIIDGDLGALHVTGAFRAGDTVGLAKALAAAFGLSAQQRSDGSLSLSRSPGLKKTGG